MAAALCAAAGSVAPAFAQAPLAVPYLPQTEALCGGAAAAMVMRFWGAQNIYADAFAPLVDKSAGGIHTSALDSALQQRGWRTVAGGSDLAHLATEVGAGRPVIALIEDRPGRYHYVVVVAASPSGSIVVHDPARAPSRTLDAGAFDRKWQKADRWMLIMLPPVNGAAVEPSRDATSSETAATGPPSACAAQVNDAVALAQRGDKDGARRLLTEATVACADDAAPWRELAGLDVMDKRWADAAMRARRAVALDPRDDYAWRLLATSEYLQQDDLAALAAWNRVGEPRVDLVDIRGLTHTRYRVVSDAIAVEPRAMLTPGALRLAQKRVRDIPAIAAARVSFHPLERGDAQIDATIVERERAPLSYPSWIGIGVGALANREILGSLTNVSGGGDAVDVSWRWWQHRPRAAASYTAPGPGGVWRLEVSRETQTFGVARVEETRSRIGGEISNWLTERVRIAGGAALDRWQGLGRTAALTARMEYWPVVDRVAIEGGLGGWQGADTRFGSASSRIRARSRASNAGTVIIGVAGAQFASTSAPSFIWPGADTGHARDVLLRAHPLLDDGVIEGGVFGRRIAFGSVEAQRWLPPVWHGLLRIAPAVFLDTARASRGLATTDERMQYDLGAGLRLAIPGSGVLRVDLAHGLRDGRTALSVGWQR